MEENIFILEWGSRQLRVLYGHYKSGRLIRIEGKEVSAKGMSQEGPFDQALAEESLQEVINHFEEDYDLKIQTFFCVVKGKGRRVFKIQNAAHYQRYLNEIFLSEGKTSLPKSGEIPTHCELYDVYDAEDEELRRAFAIPVSQRESIQKALLQQECFIESFVSVPRLVEPILKTDPLALFIEIDDEETYVYLRKGESLTFYQEFPFSVEGILKSVQEKWNFDETQALKILEWIVVPPTVDNLDWDQEEVTELYMDERFAKVKNYVADELDHLAIHIRQNLEDAGILEMGLKKAYIYGRGYQLFRSFTFIRDILPFEWYELPKTNRHQTVGRIPLDRFAPLLNWLPFCYEKRLQHRMYLEKQAKGHPWQEWARRLLGR